MTSIRIKFERANKEMEFPKGTTLKEIAEGLDKAMRKFALLGMVNGKVTDLTTPVEEDATVQILSLIHI